MAESTDVCNAVADAIAAITDGLVGTDYTIQETIDAETVGAAQTVPPITVFLSRPMQKDLEDRLAAGKCMVSVESDDHDIVTQQYSNEGKQQDLISAPAPTLIATPAPQYGPGQAWTLSGTITYGNIIGVQAGLLGSSYVVLVNDTLASVVTGLVAQCVADGIIASAVSSTSFLIAPQGGYASVLIGAPSTWLQGYSRTARHFDVMFWCTDTNIRQYLVTQTESVFRPGQKLVMPDGSQATVLAKIGTIDSDEAGRDNLFLARTRWLIEYVTTKTVTHAPIVASTLTFNVTNVDPNQPIPANML